MSRKSPVPFSLKSIKRAENDYRSVHVDSCSYVDGQLVGSVSELTGSALHKVFRILDAEFGHRSFLRKLLSVA